MAKKKHHEEHENLERWLVSYADFITLLFAFFTILYALSQTDKTKYKEAVESIQKAFMSAGGVYPLKGAPFSPHVSQPNQGSEVPPGKRDMGQHAKAETGEGMDRVNEQVKSLFERSTGLSANVDDIEVLKTSSGYKIRLGEALLFKPGSEKIKRENIPFLYEMGKRLARLELPVQIEGHSDGVETGGKLTHNSGGWQISLGRSYNMLRFMVEGSEFPSERISVVGFGETQPIASNDSPEGRAKNRRVEISILAPDTNIEDLPF